MVTMLAASANSAYVRAQLLSSRHAWYRAAAPNSAPPRPLGSLFLASKVSSLACAAASTLAGKPRRGTQPLITAAASRKRLEGLRLVESPSPPPKEVSQAVGEITTPGPPPIAPETSTLGPPPPKTLLLLPLLFPSSPEMCKALAEPSFAKILRCFARLSADPKRDSNPVSESTNAARSSSTGMPETKPQPRHTSSPDCRSTITSKPLQARHLEAADAAAIISLRRPRVQ
jgi:hypothetical protein